MFLFLTFGFNDGFFKRRLDFQTNVRHVQSARKPSYPASQATLLFFRNHSRHEQVPRHPRRRAGRQRRLRPQFTQQGAGERHSVRKLLSREKASDVQMAVPVVLVQTFQ